MDQVRVSYYPWITQHVAPGELRASVQRFVDLMAMSAAAQANALSFTLLPVAEVPEQVALVAGGGSELAFMNPLGYVLARRRAPSVTSIAVALRMIDGQVGSTYYSQVYARRTTGIVSLVPGQGPSPRGRSLLFGSPASTSNFLVPAGLLHEHGLHPLTAFSRVEFSGGHDRSVLAVYRGEADLGAGHDGVIADLARQEGCEDAAEVLVQVGRSDPIPSDPVVSNVADPIAASAIRDALFAAGGSEEGRRELAVFWGMVKGLEPIEPTAYDGLGMAMERFGLAESDVL